MTALLGGEIGTFFAMTVALFGGPAFLTGQTLAQSWRPAWQILPAALLLAAAGGLVGFLLSRAAAGPLTVLLPRAFVEDLPLSSADTAPAVALLALGLSTASGLIFGLAPAWSSSRHDPISALRYAGRSLSLGAGARRLLSVLVASEIALATIGFAIAMQSYTFIGIWHRAASVSSCGIATTSAAASSRGSAA